jgi:hypothetical protein
MRFETSAEDSISKSESRRTESSSPACTSSPTSPAKAASAFRLICCPDAQSRLSTRLGWTYLKAFNTSQKYKESKMIIEVEKIRRVCVLRYRAAANLTSIGQNNLWHEDV